jgi:CBS domain-containing protein
MEVPMTQRIRDVMTPNPVTMPPNTPIVDAARTMRDHDIGDVIVADGTKMHGIATDRDIVIRAVAEGRDPASTPISEVSTSDATTLSPDDSVGDAVHRMREQAIRRLPVVEGGRPVGIVTLGDLAIARDEDSALADISEARPDR